MAKMKKKKNWIQDAIKHPGRLTKALGGNVTVARARALMKSKTADPGLKRAAALYVNVLSKTNKKKK
jgi:hypothetical protein